MGNGHFGAHAQLLPQFSRAQCRFWGTAELYGLGGTYMQVPAKVCPVPGAVEKKVTGHECPPWRVLRGRFTGGIGESEPIHTRPSDPRASHTPADMKTNGWGCSDQGATYRLHAS